MRSEIWGKMCDWIEDEPCDIPDENSLHQDICGPLFSHTSARQIKLGSKEDMAARGLRSPDEGDGLALAFAYPVRGRITPGDRYKLTRRQAWLGCRGQTNAAPTSG